MQKLLKRDECGKFYGGGHTLGQKLLVYKLLIYLGETILYRVYNLFSGVSASGASVIGYSSPPSPPHRIFFYTVVYRVCNLFSGVSAPGASVLGYGLPPHRIFYTVDYRVYNLFSGVYTPGVSVWPPGSIVFFTLSSIEYNLLRSFCTRIFCPRVWPPPHRIIHCCL